MLQMSWTPGPVTLIDTKHHKVGALDSTLSEAISFISLCIVRLPRSSQATDNVAGTGQRKESTCGFN